MFRAGALVFVTLVWVAALGWSGQAQVPSTTLGTGRVAPATAASATALGATARAAVDQYCVTCHNQRSKIGGLALDTLNVATPHANADVWERVIKRIATRSMPPHGSARPSEATYQQLAGWLESSLDAAAAANPDPGRSPIRRLNRTEYANAIRDLFGVEIEAAALLPPDDAAFGFDNNADLLGVSPALIERYVGAADRVSALVTGQDASPASTVYRVRQDRSQDQHIEGLPLGTVGGLAVTHIFPVDGEYRLSLELFRTNLESIRGLEHPHEIEISIDGARVFSDVIGGAKDQGGPGGGAVTDRMNAIDARLRTQVRVTAGPHVVGASFLRKIGSGSTRLRPLLRSSAGTYDNTGRPHLETLTVAGPFGASAPGESEARRRLFTCVPSRASQEASCARQILEPLARRAYRRPLTGEDRTRLIEFYRAGRAKGSFDAGIQMGVRRILASPSFTFRVEASTAGPKGPAVRGEGPALLGVTGLDLASRLSFFLWSSLPDEALLDAAARGDLQKPAELERQVRRMLADPRAEALVDNFAGQWLHVRNLNTISPNHDEFQDFDDTLRAAFRQEIGLFVGSVMREDRSILDLLTADVTYVNERLAKHYGIPYVYGSHFRRVTLTDDTRRGLLGKGSLLMVTSHADRTSPVVRGKWILENLLGTPPPPPPANFALAADAPGAAPKTIRERMERHRASPACAGCHRVMDPLGFAMENYDAVGAWRSREGGRPIDASGELTDGRKIDGVVALRQSIVERPEVFYRTFAEKLMVYALGRGLDARDMPAVRQVVRGAAASDHRFSAFILGVVNSTPFQKRRSM